jgi:hypothetical protein
MFPIDQVVVLATLMAALCLLYEARPGKKCNTLVVWLKPCPD